MTLRTLAALTLLLILPAAASAADRTASFDAGWRFHLGDAPGADAAAFDDAAWRHLDVPHDYMIEGVPGADPAVMDGPFDPKSPGGAGNGYLDGGVGWYRKHFPAPPAGKHVEVQFDGVYMNAHCWLNGHDLGTHPYGYTSFAYDLTPSLTAGDNVLAVRCDVEQPCSRFYSGAGIYRHVWLTVTNPVHIDHWGTYVTSNVAPDGTATVTIRTTVRNVHPRQLGRGSWTMRCPTRTVSRRSRPRRWRTTSASTHTGQPSWSGSTPSHIRSCGA